MNTTCKTTRALYLFSAALFLGLIHSCTTHQSPVNEFHFSLLTESDTHIGFNNGIKENDSVNFLTDQYLYTGSGVGVADFNNDGLQDIFFAGEQVSCRLYINKGDLKFEDVTKQAGLTTKKGCTGVSIVDINNDGLMDIYISVSHSMQADQRKNLLFINQGNLKFTEQAADYGLANDGFSTQAAFFDYDKDGDLDMYLVNHAIFQHDPDHIVSYNVSPSPLAADVLYRNDGIPAGKNHPVFKDVSAEAGIVDNGFGLGVAISDLNSDGWPDIYVTNDFSGYDLLWLNNKNGSFRNCIDHSLHHQGYNSKGLDIADLNNDLLPDIIVADMQPKTNARKKMMFTGINPEIYERAQKVIAEQPQYSRNMLQLHNGNRVNDSIAEPFFSEIGQLAGIAETDWSWSMLSADFDNDGWKDIHVTNGVAKDYINNDFLSPGKKQADDDREQNREEKKSALLKELDGYGAVKISNYFFHNEGGIGFSDLTKGTGLDIPSISNGAVYADLDNDGDLDMVISNMNQPAFIWRNELRKTAGDSVHNFLGIRLQGDSQNKAAIGAKVTLYTINKTQLLEENPVRGYMSSVDSRIHFGIGNTHVIDSVKIVWPDGKLQLLKEVKVNQYLTISHINAVADEPGSYIIPTLFKETSNELGIRFKHEEISYFDFGSQQLLPQKYSQLGPPLATGDINGDGLTDFFVGGASYQSGMLFIQQKNGSFNPVKLDTKDKPGEDAGAIFFDADGDRDLDLLVIGGSSEFGNSTTLNVPRLYKNDGKGNFIMVEKAFPESVNAIAQTVCAGDYDKDGDLDIFIGGRVVANRYPLSPRSYILRNDGGKFTDVTNEVCTSLVKPGLITGAVWIDFDNDKNLDLVICGEYMPVRFFKNKTGHLEEVTGSTNLKNMNGWWRSLQAADIDQDGDMDLVAGNMGLNTKFHAIPDQPYWLYAKDIDGNGIIDLVPAFYIAKENDQYELFPGIDRTQFASQVLAVKKQFPTNADFAKTNMEQILGAMGKNDLLSLKCETTASVWLENKGDGQFQSHQLPIEAQFAPINALLVTDANNDGHPDLVIGGNEYHPEVSTGRYDASYGLLLQNDGKGDFISIPPRESGFIADGDIKGLQGLFMKDGSHLVLAALNNGWLKAFSTGKQKFAAKAPSSGK